jgi:putative serine protease PepD
MTQRDGSDDEPWPVFDLDRSSGDRSSGDRPAGLPSAPPPSAEVPSSETPAEASQPVFAAVPATVPAARNRRRPALLATVVAVACLLCGAVGGVVGSRWGGTRDGVDRTVTLPAAVAGDTSRDADSVAGVARAVLPSVVAIEVSGAGEGTGSGFVIDSRGYILTNNHVVAPAAGQGSVRVLFQNGSSTEARIVGRDIAYDLAVIKVGRKDLRPLGFAGSDAVVVGDPVVAIGAPLGLRGTVTTGIVSGLDRPVTAGADAETSFINAIQTDAAINPGNSGGPLVDGNGRVVGVNSAIARGAAGIGSVGTGLGFAIPGDQARRTAQQLIRTGRSEHPIIGVVLSSRYTGDGVQVASQGQQGRDPVTSGGPADKAGILPGDVILKFNGRPVTESEELIVAIRSRTPGETITLTVRRGGRDRDVRVTLDAASG